MRDRIVRWVVGVDDSDGAEAALRWATDHIVDRANTMQLVKAWHLPTTAGVEFGVALVTDLTPATAYEGSVELAAELGTKDVVVEELIEMGTASSVLLEASEDADLLVVGSRGLGGFKRLLLGSTSQQCATHARVPVAVIRTSADTDSDRSAPPRRIVVGMDGSRAGDAAVRWALDFAAADSEVQVVSAWNPATWSTDSDDPRLGERVNVLRQSFEDKVTEMVEDLADPPRVTFAFPEGHPAQELLAAGRDADMIVVGERGHTGFSAILLGSVTTHVLHHADGPIVVVPVNPE